MKIVLATAPDGWKTKQHLPSIGLLYVANALIDAGHDVKYVDAPVQCGSIEDTANKIASYQPDAVGITATMHNRAQALSLCNIVKDKTGAFVFVGGPHFTFQDINALSNRGIDAVVRGEGDITAVELLDKWPEIPFGVTAKLPSSAIYIAPDKPFIENLDSLNWPAWRIHDKALYSATLEGEYKTRSIGVISSRGCPNECTFCVNKAYWKSTIRYRSTRDFVNEVEHLERNYNYQAFDFWDDTFTINKHRVVEICDEIKRRKLGIIWYCRARVNTVDADLLRYMRKAGCVSISFGVESGSPRILKKIKKNIYLETAEYAVSEAAKLGYYVKVFFIHRLPGEAPEDLKLTLNFMDKLANMGKHVHCIAGNLQIYPGTDIEGDNSPYMTVEQVNEIVRKHNSNGVRLMSRGLNRLSRGDFAAVGRYFANR